MTGRAAWRLALVAVWPLLELARGVPVPDSVLSQSENTPRAPLATLLDPIAMLQPGVFDQSQGVQPLFDLRAGKDGANEGTRSASPSSASFSQRVGEALGADFKDSSFGPQQPKSDVPAVAQSPVVHSSDMPSDSVNVRVETEVEVVRVELGQGIKAGTGGGAADRGMGAQKGSNSSNTDDGDGLGGLSLKLTIKIAGMLLVFGASLAGVLPPVLGFSSLMGADGENPPNLFFLLRGFTAGTLLSLAFVHIIADAFEDLDGLTGTYPIASVLVLLGMFLMIVVERASLDIMMSRAATTSHMHMVVCCHSDTHNHQHQYGHTCTRFSHQNEHTHQGGPHEHEEPSFLSVREDSLVHTCCDDDSTSSHRSKSKSHVGGHIEPADQPIVRKTEESVNGLPSTHSLGSMEDEDRKIITLGMVELGMIVHTGAIGVNLGVMEASPHAMVALVIALVFHQLFEGMGLGTCIGAVQGHISSFRKISAIVGFSITFPIGTILGIVISNLGSSALFSRWIQGVPNAVCAGIILYLALVHFIAEDFSRTDVNGPSKMGLRWQMIGCMFLGASAMAVLGLWA